MISGEPQWHREAILDAEAARNWYAERSPFAARGFVLALDAAVTAVIEAPDRWPARSHGCRQYFFTSRYPCGRWSHRDRGCGSSPTDS